MLTRHEMLSSIFEMQDELNTMTTGENWVLSENRYLRGAWTEAAELFDKYDWEWWKSKELDIPQAQLEVVDIIHFVVSWELQQGVDINDLLHLEKNAEAGEDILEDIEQLVLDLLTGNSSKDIWYGIFCVARGMDMNLTDIYNLYARKVTLNRFRQNNGYKEKTYVKQWNGAEDNVFLYSIEIPRFLETNKAVCDFIYDKLEAEYNTNVLQIDKLAYEPVVYDEVSGLEESYVDADVDEAVA